MFEPFTNPIPQNKETFDLIIKNGTVIDPSQDLNDHRDIADLDIAVCRNSLGQFLIGKLV